MRSLLKFTAKFVGIVIFAFVILVLTVAVFFFATPEFSVGGSQIRWAIHKFAPASLEVEFRDIDLRLIRPQGLPFAKRLSLRIDGFCLRYEKKAVDTCFREVNLAATAGWGGERLEGEAWYFPRLIAIEPIRLIQGEVLVDLPKFPPSDDKKPKSDFDVVDLLRKQILPKWKIDGSWIEIEPMKIITAPNEGFVARFDLMTRQQGDTLRAFLREFSMLNSPVKANAIVRLTRPEDWLGSPAPKGQPEAKRAWKLWIDGKLALDAAKSIGIKGDSNIFDWKTLDFRLGTKWKGVAALREIRMDGNLKDNQIGSRLSLKMGSNGAEVKALDFANCRLDANLDKKVGGLNCGPQTVRLQLRERSLIQDRNFFVMRPQFDIRATRIAFGEIKEADLTVDLNLAHYNITTLESHWTAKVKQEPKKPLHYAAEGNLSVVVEKFHRIVKLLRRTPLEIPAPINKLDGPVKLTASASVNELGGNIHYDATTLLDSEFQSVHLRLGGDTQLRKVKDSFTPIVRGDLAVDTFRLSAPRFDLRLPPRFAPDSRFGPINPALNQEPPKIPVAKPAEPLDVKLRVHTTQSHAIQIATNLTKAAIPVDLDVTYNQQAAESERKDVPPKPGSGPAGDGAKIAPVNSNATVRTANSSEKAPAVTGWVTVGETPVELFRRNAQVREVRVDLTPTGKQVLNGLVQMHYLDYDISLLLTGSTSQPSVKLTSDPPLSDDNILAVLLFGRAPDELNDDQKDSVSNARAALANATLGISSLYLLASTPIESVGYDPVKDVVTAKVGLGGGASLELGGNGETTAVGFRKRLSKDFVFRSDVDTLGSSGKRVVSALIEWVKRF